MQKLTISPPIPEFITAPFSNLYEPIKGIQWNNSRNNVETDVSKKLEKYVVYDEDGNFIEVELAMEVSALPISTIEYVKKNHKKTTIKEASEIIRANGTVIYKVVLKRLGLFFDSNGIFIKLIKN